MTEATGRLAAALTRHPRLTIAVSGGVDSLTLASFAGRRMEITVAHAVSPAVPPAATERVYNAAKREGWPLQILNAREFADPAYLNNPVNRCYFCKSNLYARIREGTDAPIAAGTNTDDLGEYRPGLIAAKENRVVHPYIEAGIDKPTLRTIATDLGLGDVASLPAQPCLASRIETGIAIDAGDLGFVHQVEELARTCVPDADVRCRITAGGVRLESSAQLPAEAARQVEALCQLQGRKYLGQAPYRRGSAFLTEGTD